MQQCAQSSTKPRRPPGIANKAHYDVLQPPRFGQQDQSRQQIALGFLKAYVVLTPPEFAVQLGHDHKALGFGDQRIGLSDNTPSTRDIFYREINREQAIKQATPEMLSVCPRICCSTSKTPAIVSMLVLVLRRLAPQKMAFSNTNGQKYCIL